MTDPITIYPPGTQLVYNDPEFGPYRGRVVVCLCKRHTYQPEIAGWECGCGGRAAMCPRPMHVRWDGGGESHEGMHVAPVGTCAEVKRWWERDDRPAHMRPVPERSGEGAIYSVEYLIEREGNAYGTRPFEPRLLPYDDDLCD